MDEEGEHIYTISITLSFGVPVVSKNINRLLMMDGLGNCSLVQLQGFRICHYSLNSSNKYFLSTYHVTSTVLNAEETAVSRPKIAMNGPETDSSPRILLL